MVSVTTATAMRGAHYLWPRHTVPMATLYRCSTPTDWLCACGRVARELRRAGVEVTQVRVSQRRRLRDEVQALSGQRRVPLLVIDGEAICDSHRIVEHLEWRAGHDGIERRRGVSPR